MADKSEEGSRGAATEYHQRLGGAARQAGRQPKSGAELLRSAEQGLRSAAHEACSLVRRHPMVAIGIGAAIAAAVTAAVLATRGHHHESHWHRLGRKARERAAFALDRAGRSELAREARRRLHR